MSDNLCIPRRNEYVCGMFCSFCFQELFLIPHVQWNKTDKEGRKEGSKEGRKKGRKEGKKEEREEGREEGNRKAGEGGRGPIGNGLCSNTKGYYTMCTYHITIWTPENPG